MRGRWGSVTAPEITAPAGGKRERPRDRAGGHEKKGSEELALAVPAEGRERRLGSGPGRLPAAVEKKVF